LWKHRGFCAILGAMKHCNKCDTDKPLGQFNKKGATRLQAWCKECTNIASRERYHRDRDLHKLHVKINRKTRMDSIKSWVRNFKSETPCFDCGNKFPWYVMDFDHVNGEKVAPISYMISNGNSEAKIIEEIYKCDLVCSNCHRERTFRRSGHSEIDKIEFRSE